MYSIVWLSCPTLGLCNHECFLYYLVISARLTDTAYKYAVFSPRFNPQGDKLVSESRLTCVGCCCSTHCVLARCSLRQWLTVPTTPVLLSKWSVRQPFVKPSLALFLSVYVYACVVLQIEWPSRRVSTVVDVVNRPQCKLPYFSPPLTNLSYYLSVSLVTQREHSQDSTPSNCLRGAGTPQGRDLCSTTGGEAYRYMTPVKAHQFQIKHTGSK